MPIDFRNTNTVWASVLVTTLERLGLTTAVICPGSRSAPLAIAFAQSTSIQAMPILDERSASFFALGVARQSGLPVALICTSGTATANFYPAIIEARESGVPLLVLTADRPPELRHCHAGQAIDQQKLFGSFPNWYCEIATPSLQLDLLNYLRQTLIHAWERTQWPEAGPVHLNLPFREPLAPTPEADASELQTLITQWSEAAFFSAVEPPPAPSISMPPPGDADPAMAAMCPGLDYCRGGATPRSLGLLSGDRSPVSNLGLARLCRGAFPGKECGGSQPWPDFHL